MITPEELCAGTFSISKSQTSLMSTLTSVWLFWTFKPAHSWSHAFMNRITLLELHAPFCKFTGRVSKSKYQLGWDVPTSEIYVYWFCWFQKAKSWFRYVIWGSTWKEKTMETTSIKITHIWGESIKLWNCGSGLIPYGTPCYIYRIERGQPGRAVWKELLT